MNKAPFGSWHSRVDAAMIAAGSVTVSEPRPVGERLYWCESRPEESGRSVVVEQAVEGSRRDLLKAPWSARSSVHEYGGRAWTLSPLHLYFVNGADQQIYRVNLSAGAVDKPEQLTHLPHARFADLEWSEPLQRLFAVCEDHETSGEPANRLVYLAFADQQVTLHSLASGANFYSCARLSPSGKDVCWLQWNHPQTPWFGCELWRAKIGKSGSAESAVRVAGGDAEAIFQPDWHPSGDLLFCSDLGGNWNLWRARGGKTRQLSRFEGECGLPYWQFGMQTWALLGVETALCAVCTQGEWGLVKLDLTTGATSPIAQEFRLIQHVSSDGERALVLGGSATVAQTMLLLQQSKPVRKLELTGTLKLESDWVSLGKAITFPTTDEMQAHGYFYSPVNPGYEASKSALPPLIVMCHGGPTAAANAALSLKVQFWTSRGFAVMDVNYRGSTAYGRNYRCLLDGKWGIYDVDDANAAAQYLIDQGLVNPKQCVIRGSSAGGLTLLNALAGGSTFSAGCSIYGVGDLTTLVTDTHKFESCYGDRLIAPWPENQGEYYRRSPINRVQSLNCPIIFFQGLKDFVVPPDQAERMAAALRERGIPVALVTYADEGHGFRSAATIQHSLQAELAFYGAVFGFPTDSTVTDLQIDNLAQA